MSQIHVWLALIPPFQHACQGGPFPVEDWGRLATYAVIFKDFGGDIIRKLVKW